MKAFKQETDFSCGASALKNCIYHLSHKHYTEPYLRKLCGTTKQGTARQGLLDAISALKFNGNHIQTKSERRFRKVIRNTLINGGTIILSSDNLYHYIALIKYERRRVVVIDSETRPIEKRRTFKELCDIGLNRDKATDLKYFDIITIT